jgi:hypothetical protein
MDTTIEAPGEAPGEASFNAVNIYILKTTKASSNKKSRYHRIYTRYGATGIPIYLDNEQIKVVGEILSEGEPHSFSKKENTLTLKTDYSFAFLLSVDRNILNVTLTDGCSQLFIIGNPLSSDSKEEVIELSCDEDKSPSFTLDIFKYHRISICCGKYFSIVLQKNNDDNDDNDDC